jgi:hypothetical protein
MNVSLPSKSETLLGLSFDGDWVTAASVTRAGNRAVVRQIGRWQMVLDVLSSDPPLVAREIQDELEARGIREKRCVVCLPLKWALTIGVDLPDIEGDDIDSFIALRAEREFPFAPDELALASSLHGIGGDSPGALVAAMPANHIDTIATICKAAQLRLVGITVGIAEVIQSSHDGQEIALLISSSGVDLGIAAADGFIVLRSLVDSPRTNHGEVEFDSDVIARQLRISLSQLPGSLLQEGAPIRIYGPPAAVADAMEELREPLAAQGMRVELAPGPGADTAESATGQEESHATPGAIAAAANKLLGHESEIQFQAPHTNALTKFINRVSARSTLWLGGVAAAALLIFGFLFLYQHVKLIRLEARWSELAPQVEEVETLQANVRAFRSWFDNSAISLTIAKKLTNAFPEDGSVWATSLSIVDRERVVCVAKAENDAAWLGVHEALRNTPGVNDVKLTQVRGSSPYQFSLSYRWAPGESSGI